MEGSDLQDLQLGVHQIDLPQAGKRVALLKHICGGGKVSLQLCSNGHYVGSFFFRLIETHT